MAAFIEGYRETRERVIEFVSGLSEDELATRTPTCPEWTVKDLYCHVVGIAADTLAGNVAEAGRGGWTAKQVGDRRDRPLEEITKEWMETAVKLEPALDDIHPAASGGLIGDLFTHEQDMRGALNKPGGRDSKGAAIALDSYVRFFGRRVKNTELPSVEVRSGDRDWVAGKGDPAITIKADPYELLRCLTGRRTKDQIRALGWDGDPEPYIEIFSTYSFPDEPIYE